jgi:hypothetical protein
MAVRRPEPEVPRMLSPRAIYGEIFSNDEAFRLFCSIAASGEAQGGWESGCCLAPGPDGCRGGGGGNRQALCAFGGRRQGDW